MEGGFHQPKRLSPTGIAVVVLLHGAAVTALMTAKMEFVRKVIPPIEVISIPLPKDPPPEQMPQPKQEPQQRSTIDTVKPIVELPNLKTPPIDYTKVELPPIPHLPTGTTDVLLPPPPPVRDPVRTPPQIDAHSALQPPYPAGAQREGAEGTVEVRVAIGADGRVRAVEKLRASRDDFYAATERQALRYWRFKPALVDGKPIESSKVMTVHFRLDDLG